MCVQEGIFRCMDKNETVTYTDCVHADINNELTKACYA